jgi:hypothetical protein
MRTERRFSSKYESGIVFYLVVIGMAATMAMFTIGLQMTSGWFNGKRAEEQRVLQDARRLLLGHLVSADLDTSGRRLGEWGIFPDLPIATGTGIEVTEPNYDGLGESSGCATRTWLPGQALSATNISGADARCIGRIPWKTLGLAVPEAGDDPHALIPWVIFSPNLTTQASCVLDLHPANLGQNFTGYGCTGKLPYPWITVLDERGNVRSNRVAIAIILPGSVLPGQNRQPTSGPNDFLDTLTIAVNCPTPCQPGTYSNANFAHSNTQPTILVQSGNDARAAERMGFYSMPYAFNDVMVYITVDEVMAVLEARAKMAIKNALAGFKATYGHYPYAADIAIGTGECVVNQRFGRIPTQQGSCTANGHLTLPAWLTNAGWHRYFFYTISARCNASNSSCNAPGLVVGTNNAVNALLLSPGSPISTAPFASAKNGPQIPLSGSSLSSNLADYVDAIENTAGAIDVFEATLSQPFPNNDRLEILN